MFSLRLICLAAEMDRISAELWEAGTAGIQEIDSGENTLLIAGFATNECRDELLHRFRDFHPEWSLQPIIDWVQNTKAAWPARPIGDRLFLAPMWSDEATPPGRQRIIHNPGLACGTGEHPCTQLALIALEEHVVENCTVVDVGTGSGILSIAALRLGAAYAVGLDIDSAALEAARENFELNRLNGNLVAGTIHCIADGTCDISIANISGTVLLSLMDELLRITRANGWLILTGFSEAEAGVFQRLFPDSRVHTFEGWACVTAKNFSPLFSMDEIS